MNPKREQHSDQKLLTMFRYSSFKLAKQQRAVTKPTLNVQECTEVPFPKALSAVEVERALGKRTQRLWRRFLIARKNLVFRLGTKRNGPFHRRFFGKIGVQFAVLLFSRFYQNDGKIAVPFALSHYFCSLMKYAAVSMNNELEQSFPLECF